MLSNVRDKPHGASFQAWGARVSAAFGASHGVRVTTRHAYVIEYKYVWQCEGEGCGALFKRHSKSVDVERQRCGSCKGRLVQIQPVPRVAKGSGGEGDGRAKEVGGYAGFVKVHFAAIKKDMGPGVPHKLVMEALGRKYREEKAGVVPAEKEGKAVVVAIEEVESEDDGSEYKTHGRGDADVDAVADALEVVVIDDSD